MLTLSVAAISGCPSAPTAEPVELTPEQEAGIAAALETASTVAAATAGVFEATDLQTFIASFGEAGPDCPTVEWSGVGRHVSLTFDYGEGCSPNVYPETMLAGAISGSLDA